MSAEIYDINRSRDGQHSLPIPAAIEAEQAVLGAILLGNSALAAVAPHVGVDDFGEEMHRRIFDVASQLIGAGQPASPILTAS